HGWTAENACGNQARKRKGISWQKARAGKGCHRSGSVGMGSVETSPRTTNETHSTLQERHPDWPKLSVSFYFAPHGNFEDMQGIVSKIKESDVFFYEDLGRSEAKAAYLNSPLLREG